MGDDSNIPKISINPALALVNLSRAVSQVNNTFNRDEASAKNYRLASDATVVTGNHQMSNNNVVYYTGTGGHIVTLPSAQARGKSIGQTVVIVNAGRASITVNVQKSATEKLNTNLTSVPLSNNRSVMCTSDGLTRWSAWFSSNGGDYEAYVHRGGSSLVAWRFAGCINQTALVLGAPSANILRAIPMIAPQDSPYMSTMGFSVTTLTAGGARIGLYNNTSPSNLYPKSLLFDSGNLDTGTAGLKTAASTLSLVPGDLYWAVHCGSSAPTLQCLSLANMPHTLGVPAALNAVNVGISVAFTYAALPAAFPTGGAMIQAIPIPALGYTMT